MRGQLVTLLWVCAVVTHYGRKVWQRETTSGTGQGDRREKGRDLGTVNDLKAS